MIVSAVPYFRRLRALQDWLFTTATKDRNRKYRVGKLLYSRPVLEAALARLERSRGCDTPGCDGVALKDLDWEAKSRLLDQVAEELRSGKYKPARLKPGYIKKNDGSGRKRRLGIPTIRDRLVQHAIGLLLYPVVESELSGRCYGGRLGGGPQKTLSAIRHALEAADGDVHIVRTDIRDYYNNIPHNGLKKLLGRRFGGKHLPGILEQQLRFWATEKTKGIPQGPPLSVLLANWLLADIDRFFERRSTVRYFRYLDDIVILVPGGEDCARTCLTELQAKLNKLGLTLAEKNKTQIANAKMGIDFLGVHIQMTETGVQMQPSADSWKKLIHKILDKANKGTDQDDLVQELQALKGAWLAYFGEELADEVQKHIEQLLGRGHRNGGGGHHLDHDLQDHDGEPDLADAGHDLRDESAEGGPADHAQECTDWDSRTDQELIEECGSLLLARGAVALRCSTVGAMSGDILARERLDPSALPEFDLREGLHEMAMFRPGYRRELTRLQQAISRHRNVRNREVRALVEEGCSQSDAERRVDLAARTDAEQHQRVRDRARELNAILTGYKMAERRLLEEVNRRRTAKTTTASRGGE